VQDTISRLDDADVRKPFQRRAAPEGEFEYSGVLVEIVHDK
jgi:hypothetical protein